MVTLRRIGEVSAHLSHETPRYGTETKEKIRDWANSIADLNQGAAKCTRPRVCGRWPWKPRVRVHCRNCMELLFFVFLGR